MLNNEDLEKALSELKYPHITPEYIEGRIKSQIFARFGKTSTVCYITLDNGFSVFGESACAVPENYNQEIGETLARKDAVGKLWPFFGFMLCESRKLSN